MLEDVLVDGTWDFVTRGDAGLVDNNVHSHCEDLDWICYEMGGFLFCEGKVLDDLMVRIESAVCCMVLT